MPIVSIRLAGTATREQKAAVIADITRSLAERMGKAPASVRVVIEEISLENYAVAGRLLADGDEAAAPAPSAAPAPAVAREPELALDGEDADADPSR